MGQDHSGLKSRDVQVVVRGAQRPDSAVRLKPIVGIRGGLANGVNKPRDPTGRILRAA